MSDAPPVAVALTYGGEGAPVVSAKGRGEVAQKILEVAREHDVPLWQDPDLAGVLAQIDLGEQIPRQLYVAVAEVIAFAWQLRADAGETPASGTDAALPPGPGQ